MPINKAVLAAFKAATRLRPDIREFYKTQRLAEDVSAKLVLPNPRCRIDEAFATDARRLRGAAARVHAA